MKALTVNMKNLEAIIKTARTLRNLCRIAMIISFAGAFACLVATGVLCFMGSGSYLSGNTIVMYIIGVTEGDGFVTTLAALLRDFTVSLTEGVILIFSNKYLCSLLRDGSPFTVDGARRMRNLGIRTIIMPFIDVIICSIINKCLKINNTEYLLNGFSVAAGFGLILFSLVISYGVEQLGE